MFISCDKSTVYVIAVLVLVTLTMAVPQKVGSAYTQKALREIEQRQLIPPNARIDRVR